MTGIIIQARMSSTRLPGKVMLPLAGKEMLWHIVTRCAQCREADKVVVATSANASDAVIEHFCRRNGFEVFCGDLLDVLKRYYDCATECGLDTIARVTADCPLIEPRIIDESIELFRSQHADYVSNVLDRTFPRGLDCEVFSYTILKQAYEKAADPFEREHVTPWIVKHGRALPYRVPEEYKGNFRLTVDERQDFEFMQEIYERFYQSTAIIDTGKIIQYLHNHQEHAHKNRTVAQKHSVN